MGARLRMCPPGRANVSSFWLHVSTLTGHVSSLARDVSTLTGHVSSSWPNVFSFWRRALPGFSRPRGGNIPASASSGRASTGSGQVLGGLGTATRGARSVGERTVVLRVSGPRPGEQVFNLNANVFTFAADVFTFAGNVFSFRPNVFSSGAEVFSPRRGGIQFGDSRNSDWQAPGRRARSGPLRCSCTPCPPASRVGHARSSFAVSVKRSLGPTRCRALQPIRALVCETGGDRFKC